MIKFLTVNTWRLWFTLASVFLVYHEVLADLNEDKRLFLSATEIAHLDRINLEKQPIELPDIGSEKEIWLHYRGYMTKDNSISLLINKQWIQKPTKIHGVLISPKNVSSLGALSIAIAGDVLWLSPGQSLRISDLWIE